MNLWDYRSRGWDIASTLLISTTCSQCGWDLSADLALWSEAALRVMLSREQLRVFFVLWSVDPGMKHCQSYVHKYRKAKMFEEVKCSGSCPFFFPKHQSVCKYCHYPYKPCHSLKLLCSFGSPETVSWWCKTSPLTGSISQLILVKSAHHP